MIRLGVLVAVPALATALVAGSARATPTVRWSSGQVLERLERGDRLLLDQARIRGDLDLTALGLVEGSFICTDCRLQGSLLASNVVFQAPVDLSGMEITGRVNLHGATFESPAVFGAEWAAKTTRVSGYADFSFVTFEDFAGFQRAVFEKRADFRLARFRSDSVFANARFSGAADFSAAIFGGPTRFGQGEFEDTATFARADFQHRADFSQTRFTKAASFSRTQFADGAVFLGARFSGRGSQRSASFDLCASEGKLDFTDATFSNGVTFRNLVTPVAWFDATTFPSRSTVTMSGISSGDLLFEVESVERVLPDDRIRVLRLIESSAKARQNLTVANQAHYRLQVLASRDDVWWRRFLDVVFYRGVAGYFVKFWRPLVALLVLAFVVSAYRARRSRPEPATGTIGFSADAWRRASARSQSVLNEFLDTLALVGPGKSDPPRRLERLTYRVLFACALLGLANANPTLRQMIDTLF